MGRHGYVTGTALPLFFIYACERKMLRKQYRPEIEQEGWGIRPRKELGELYRRPDLVVHVKRKR
jgi:hypothetical protein